jgi:ribosomal protein S18 acetylase RimI-like enzyme
MPEMRRSEHIGLADLGGMQSLAERVFPITGYRSVGELAWNYALSYDRPQEHLTALWRDAGDVVAWGWLERPADLVLQVDPRYPGLPGEVLAWAEQLSSEPLTVDIADTEADVAAELSARGYQMEDGPYFSCLGMPIDAAPPGPALPVGYRIREVGSGHAAQWVAAHRAAFPGSRFDVARRQLLTSVQPYRRDFDLAIEAPDGSFAAYCLGWYDERNRTGEFEPVGTHPAHQRLGLGRCVTIAVLHAFAAAGAQRAVVNARGDGAYPAPKRLYEALGFRQHTRTRTFGGKPATA